MSTRHRPHGITVYKFTISYYSCKCPLSSQFSYYTVSEIDSCSYLFVGSTYILVCMVVVHTTAVHNLGNID